MPRWLLALIVCLALATGFVFHNPVAKLMVETRQDLRSGTDELRYLYDRVVIVSSIH
jgi:hypothetical protein